MNEEDDKIEGSRNSKEKTFGRYSPLEQVYTDTVLFMRMSTREDYVFVIPKDTLPDDLTKNGLDTPPTL